jgi:hypothetical protein
MAIETMLEQHIMHVFNICLLIGGIATVWMVCMHYQKSNLPKRRTIAILSVIELTLTAIMVVYVSLGIQDGWSIELSRIISLGFANPFEFMIRTWIGFTVLQSLMWLRVIIHTRKQPTSEQKTPSQATAN